MSLLELTPQGLADALLAVFEGPARLKAYQDPGGVWTIGRGHTAGVTEGMVCTVNQSAEWFFDDERPLFTVVSGLQPIAQAGYVSFGFNCGKRALVRVLRGEDTIMNPVHTTDRTGRTLAGLQSRRRLEALLVEFGLQL